MEMHLKKPSNDFQCQIFEENTHTHTHNSLLNKDKLFFTKRGFPALLFPPVKWYLLYFVKSPDMSFLGSMFSTALSLETTS